MTELDKLFAGHCKAMCRVELAQVRKFRCNACMDRMLDIVVESNS